jgi:hypothetical protein
MALDGFAATERRLALSLAAASGTHDGNAFFTD